MTTTITATFEFELGELVYIRGAPHDNFHTPKQFCIVAQLAEQCSGGMQKHYRLVGYDRVVPEIALTRDAPEKKEPSWRDAVRREGEDETRERYK